MPEVRQNIITRDWVIIATERARRPNDFCAAASTDTRPRPSYRKDCPFCEGNEELCTKPVFSIPAEGKPRVRIVTNKFAALQSKGELEHRYDGIRRSVSGVGYHDVVIESARHDQILPLMSSGEAVEVVDAYRARYRELRKDRRVEAIVIFKNHGAAAGTSLEHSHSQIAAMPVVPFQVRTRLEDATRHFDDTGQCVFCRTLADELASGERIICQNAHFVAFIPWAALSPFHIWVFPRKHRSSFHKISDEERDAFADILRDVLARLYHGLNDPPYNFSIRSVPTHLGETDFFHWYLAIVPRVARMAGFEIGSGMFINSSLPESSARFLRETLPPPPKPRNFSGVA